MSRRNKGTPKFAVCTTDLRQKALYIYESWNEALREHTSRKDFQEIPEELKNMEKRVSCDSLVSSVCAWVEQTPEWDRLWKSVLERVETTQFLNGGLSSTFIPSLAWIFTFGKGSTRNIDKIIEGRYDSWKPSYRRFHADDAI